MSIKVKPLVWTQEELSGDWISGRYSIEDFKHGSFMVNLDGFFLEMSHDGLDAAKEIAYNHHKNFIMESIEQ